MPARLLLALSLSACAVAPAAGPVVGPAPAAAASACPHGGTRLARYELLFGASRQGGAPIAADEWRGFLDAEVTPRFPDGLTALDGYGQWRAPGGELSREPSRVLLIWAPASAETDASLESIRAAYKALFGQLSVMRVDGAEDCVSF